MKRFTCIISVFLACIIEVQARNYVVCIGIADYPGTDNDLELSATDAITMQHLYEKSNNTYAVSYINEQATINNVVLAVEENFYKASEQDAIILFFSGHGLPGCFICYDGFLKYNDLTLAMSKSKAKCKMVFADACFSGKAREETPETAEEIKGDVLFFLSSRSSETSMERKWGWRNSLFTGYLERGLRGGADANRDRVITARELYLFVYQGVVEQSNRQQHPVMWGRFSDDMPIMTWERRY